MRCVDVTGRQVDCNLMKSGMLSSGFYFEVPPEGQAPTRWLNLDGKAIEVLNGLVALPDAESPNLRFIDDPWYRHLIKVILIVAIAAMFVNTVTKMAL